MTPPSQDMSKQDVYKRQLLLDEPFNGLDAEAAGKLCVMLRSLAPQTLVLLVSHQLAPLQALDVSFFFMSCV